MSSTLQTQENEKILQLTLREGLRKTATVVKLHHNTDKRVEKREGEEFQRASAMQCLVHCAAI
jgi:hypothetical protein